MVYVYFWEVPGEEDMGWYIGIKVGSKGILGFNKGRSRIPPSSGWCLCPSDQLAAGTVEELKAAAGWGFTSPSPSHQQDPTSPPLFPTRMLAEVDFNQNASQPSNAL